MSVSTTATGVSLNSRAHEQSIAEVRRESLAYRLHNDAGESQVTPAALWLQDYLLTLDDEVQFMTTAKERWRLARLLFVITRYLPIVDLSMTLYVVSLDATEAYKVSTREKKRAVHHLSEEQCYPLFCASGVTFLVTILASEGLLFIRTWVLWHDSRRIRLFIAIMFGCLVVLTVVFLACAFVSLKPYSAPSLYMSDCLSLDMNPFDTLGLVVFAIFELTICFLTAYRAIRHCRSVPVPKLLKALCQGNLVYTVALLLTTVANLYVLLNVRWKNQSASLNQMQLVLHSVLASRILFGLRSTDHADDHQQTPLSALKFATSPVTIDPQVMDIRRLSSGHWELGV
ncbi:hypothetical protein F5I97DRAFT_1928348 [Phlebopus sp. FC_14]|nr:hypothetical protein F5I97DRAFT_1928348 [Phlebopus sp. FC_14]